jgi:hypothetical protein
MVLYSLDHDITRCLRVNGDTCDQSGGLSGTRYVTTSGNGVLIDYYYRAGVFMGTSSVTKFV